MASKEFEEHKGNFANRSKEELKAISEKGNEAKRLKKQESEINQWKSINFKSVISLMLLSPLDAKSKAYKSITSLGIPNPALIHWLLYELVKKGNPQALQMFIDMVGEPEETENENYELPSSFVDSQYSYIDKHIVPNKSYIFVGGRGSLKSTYISGKIIELIKQNPMLNACAIRQYQTTLKDSVYAQFEKGIFDYLTRKKGKRYSIYVEPQEYSVYNSAIYYLSEKGLPILKTKVFDSSKYPSLYHMRCCIKYVLHYTSYNVDYILRHIKRKYNIEFTQDEIESVDLTKLPEKYKIFEPRNSAEEILNFVGNDRFYIYGTGMFGSMLYWRIGLNNPMFLGFIVSDYQFCDEAKYEHRIYKFSEIEDVVSAKIVIATNAEIAKEIIKQFPNRNNLIQIY